MRKPPKNGKLNENSVHHVTITNPYLIKCYNRQIKCNNWCYLLLNEKEHCIKLHRSDT